MKKIYSLFFLLMLFMAKNSIAQNDCSTPYQFTGSMYTYTVTTGTANPDSTNDYGCLVTTPNPTWFYFQTCGSGNIDLTIQSVGSSSVDVDFVAWGPLSAPTDCGLDSTQIVDCSYSTGSVEYVTILGVTAGQYYKILISNFSNLPGSVMITTSGTFGALICDSTYCGSLPAQQICKVSTDPVINRNLIFWDKDSAFTGSYNIQKETTTMGVFATIAMIPSTDTSVYVDTVSNPMIQAFKYRIETTDSCGNTLIGYPHTTIHLLTSISSSTGYPQLAWSPYVGFSYGTYFIYRGSSPTTLNLYDSISASFNSYTDVVAVSGLNYYAISVLPPAPCTPSRIMDNFSLSNVAPVTFVGISENEFSNLSVGPNPANEVLNFSLGTLTSAVTIDIIDITGRIILSKKYTNIVQDAMTLNEISNGSYVVRFVSENGTAHKNIIIVR